jgi:hypothetical protein
MKYELLTFDYDPETGYFISSRWLHDDLNRLYREAEKDAGEDGHYVGSWIFQDGKAIKGFGFNPGYNPQLIVP